jgi:hypothetical protein
MLYALASARAGRSCTVKHLPSMAGRKAVARRWREGRRSVTKKRKGDGMLPWFQAGFESDFVLTKGVIPPQDGKWGPRLPN